MRSIGLDLEPAVERQKLQIVAERPTVAGLEMHLIGIHRRVRDFEPHVVIIDPVSNFAPLGSAAEVKAMLTRLIDFFKMHHITALFTCLTGGEEIVESTRVGVSSLMDCWLLLRDLEHGAERNRVLHLMKSRGMAHSNQVREFLLTDHGVELRDVYTGPSGALITGSARDVIEAHEQAEARTRELATAALRRDLERKRHLLDEQVALLRAHFAAEESDAARAIEIAEAGAAKLAAQRLRMGHLRQRGASDGLTVANGRPGAVE
jgi:circadian clock protein KaiC